MYIHARSHYATCIGVQVANNQPRVMYTCLTVSHVYCDTGGIFLIFFFNFFLKEISQFIFLNFFNINFFG
jgi:hypothetical protein